MLNFVTTREVKMCVVDNPHPHTLRVLIFYFPGDASKGLEQATLIGDFIKMSGHQGAYTRLVFNGYAIYCSSCGSEWVLIDANDEFRLCIGDCS